MMLAKIAWRSIWRNPRRSWVLISAVAVGVFTFVSVVSYVDGLSEQLVRTAIELQGGHIQVAGAGYFENPSIHTQLHAAQVAAAELDTVEGVRYAMQRRAPGMISSAERSAGTAIIGVDPARERAVSPVPSMIVEGNWLDDDASENGIVIGAAMAARLDVRLGERVVLMASDLTGDIGAGAFRVRGLFRSTSQDFEKAHVFLHHEEADALIGFAPESASTLAVSVGPKLNVEQVAAGLRTALAGKRAEVLTWRDRSPMLVMMEDMSQTTNAILVAILFTAIGFTLINSFVMVIFERMREIGIMAAGGVRPGQVRLLLFLEAAFVVLLGMGAGLTLAAGLISWWSVQGLDLSAFAEGLSSFGAGAVVYPSVDPARLASGFLVIFVMVFLAVLYPAVKASRLKIVDALTHV